MAFPETAVQSDALAEVERVLGSHCEGSPPLPLGSSDNDTLTTWPRTRQRKPRVFVGRLGEVLHHLQRVPLGPRGFRFRLRSALISLTGGGTSSLRRRRSQVCGGSERSAASRRTATPNGVRHHRRTERSDTFRRPHAAARHLCVVHGGLVCRIGRCCCDRAREAEPRRSRPTRKRETPHSCRQVWSGVREESFKLKARCFDGY